MKRCLQPKEGHKVGKQLVHVRRVSRAQKPGEPSEKESIEDSRILGVGDVADGTENRSVADEKT